MSIKKITKESEDLYQKIKNEFNIVNEDDIYDEGLSQDERSKVKDKLNDYKEKDRIRSIKKYYEKKEKQIATQRKYQKEIKKKWNDDLSREAKKKISDYGKKYRKMKKMLQMKNEFMIYKIKIEPKNDIKEDSKLHIYLDGFNEIEIPYDKGKHLKIGDKVKIYLEVIKTE